ncbi:hypothetical protein TorRG33x02_174510 [Trema orientale]|uniref:Uncharacterized protein n=1 Tax=Trema orientale TaxID=63057 RepID=A0A2P5EMT0_TREOI|nr:hypothetical protein TorRG33x02_174510 [Trema orientale]
MVSVMMLRSLPQPELCSNQSEASSASGRTKSIGFLGSFSLSGIESASTGSGFTVLPGKITNSTQVNMNSCTGQPHWNPFELGNSGEIPYCFLEWTKKQIFKGKKKEKDKKELSISTLE